MKLEIGGQAVHKLTGKEEFVARLEDFRDKWTPRFSRGNLLRGGAALSVGAFPIAGIGSVFAQELDQAEVVMTPNQGARLRLATVCESLDSLPSTGGDPEKIPLFFNMSLRNLSPNTLNVSWKTYTGKEIPGGSLEPFSQRPVTAVPDMLWIGRDQQGNCVDGAYAREGSQILDIVPLSVPEKIGDLATDKIEIHNMSRQIGVVPTNFAEFVGFAQRLAPRGIVFYYYDWDQLNQMPNDGLPNQVSLPSGLVVNPHEIHFDPVLGIPYGRRARITRPDGVFEFHTSLPNLPEGPKLEEFGHGTDFDVLQHICGKDAIDARCFGIDQQANTRALDALSKRGQPNFRVFRTTPPAVGPAFAQEPEQPAEVTGVEDSPAT